MKKTEFLMIFALAAFMVFFTGCNTFKSTDDPEALAAVSEEERQERAIGEQMLDYFRKNDAGGFVSFLPAGAQKQAQQDFEAAVKNMEQVGTPVSYRFLSRLEMEPLHCLVWAVRFQRAKLDGSELYHEMLYRVIIARDGDKIVVLGFNFI